MMEEWGMYVLGMVCGAIISGAVVNSILEVPKRECEAELPRNVECVWRAP
jgi:hypothetical protein